MLISNHRETAQLLKNENSSLSAKIVSLKSEVMQTELDKKKLESIKADLDYNLRASEYNVEILKNQIENLNTEMGLLKNKNEKQKRYIQIQKSKNERVCLDLEHYKKSYKKGQKPAVGKLNESMMTPRAAGKG